MLGAGSRKPGRRRRAWALVALAVAAVTAGCQSPTGNLDDAVDVTPEGSGVRVSGWTWDRDTQESTTVHVYVNGVWAAALPADLPRPDVPQAIAGAPLNVGFSAVVPVGPGTHTVCAYGIDRAGGDGNALLGCKQVTVLHGYSPIGSVDHAGELGPDGGIKVSGWTWDRDTSAPADVHVYVDGAWGTAVTADLPRPDVPRAIPGAPQQVGFTAAVPAYRGTHEVCVHGIDEVGGNPNALLGCRRVVVTTGPFAPGRTLDVPYGPDPLHQLDVHRPTHQGDPLPAVVYYHSGGWVGGDKDSFGDSGLQAYVDGGRAVAISANYRLAPEHRFPVPVQDAKAVVRWVKANAAALGVDPGRVIVMGSSSGGNLAAMVGATPGHFEPTGLPATLLAQDSTVAGVVNLVGPSDFTTFHQAGGWAPPLTAHYLGCPISPDLLVVDCPEDLAREASVTPWITASVPPAAHLYGELDTLVVPSTQGEPLAAAWSAARGGQGVVFRVVPGHGHNLAPNSIPEYTAFMDALLGP